MGNPFEDIKILFSKIGDIESLSQPYLLNRILSFNKSTFGLASKLNDRIFWIDPEIAFHIMNANIPKQRVPFFRYIKKDEFSDSRYDFILKPLYKYFHWTDNESREMYSLMRKLVENKDFLYKAMCFIGSSKELFEREGFKFDMKEVEKCQPNLEIWAK